MGQALMASKPAPAAEAPWLPSANHDDVERVRAFWRRVEHFRPGMQVGGRAEEERDRLLVIVAGWACELRILPDGRRQIFGFLLPGDIIETGAACDLGGRGVVALTRLQIVEAEDLGADASAARKRLEEVRASREERLYDHIVRVGRMTARERILHLLLELRDRLDAVGLVRDETFKIPLTQELFADALGLSVVHINRTLRALKQEGCVSIRSGSVTLHERLRWAGTCGYDASREPGEFAEAPAGWERRYAGRA